MLHRLRKLLVQEVPENLSVCEFECPVTRCTTSRWAVCTLRAQAASDGYAARVSPARYEVSFQPKLRGIG